MTDQRGVVHEYSYDGRGRMTHDMVTNETMPNGVDGAGQSTLLCLCNRSYTASDTQASSARDEFQGRAWTSPEIRGLEVNSTETMWPSSTMGSIDQ